MKKYPKYKDSGVNWMGEMPEYWAIKRMKSLFAYHKAGAWGEDAKNNSFDRVCLRIADFDYSRLKFKTNIEYTKRNYKEKIISSLFLNEGDILIEKSGGGEKTPVGRCVIYDMDLIEPLYANFMEKLVVRKTVSPQYIVYLLNTMYSNGAIWKYIKQTTGLQNLDLDSLLSYEYLPSPSISEQKAIVSFLKTKSSQIDLSISETEKEIEKLNELKQTEIAHLVTHGLNPNVPMKDSGIPWIGQIPEHWEVKHLRKYLKLISEKGHGEEQLLSVTREQGVIARNIESVDENHNYIPDDLSGYKLVKEGQFAINKMKSWQGSYGVSPYCGIVSPAYFVCELNFNDKEFFNIAIRSKIYVPFFTQYSKGIRVDQWDLSPLALKAIPFIEPPIDEMKAIVTTVNKITSKIDLMVSELNNQITYLKELKQRIISDAVTGKIDVREGSIS
jgi:type I restriction enzyme, S subunit